MQSLRKAGAAEKRLLLAVCGCLGIFEYAVGREGEEEGRDGGGEEQALAPGKGAMGGDVDGVIGVGNEGAESGERAIEDGGKAGGVAVGFGRHAFAAAEVEGERRGGAGLVAERAAAHFEDGARVGLLTVLDENAEPCRTLKISTEGEGQEGMLRVDGAVHAFRWRGAEDGASDRCGYVELKR